MLTFARYWEDEAHTKAAMKPDDNGTLWMHTGDEAVMDEEGYVRSEFYSGHAFDFRSADWSFSCWAREGEITYLDRHCSDSLTYII